MGIIYLIQNLVNENCYVGKTVHSLESRWNAHIKTAFKGAPWPLSKAIRKYGPENFALCILMTVPEDQLNVSERFCISIFGSSRHGYNATNGGDGGEVLDPEARERMRLAAKCKRTPEQRKRMSDARKKMIASNPGFKEKLVNHCRKIAGQFEVTDDLRNKRSENARGNISVRGKHWHWHSQEVAN